MSVGRQRGFGFGKALLLLALIAAALWAWWTYAPDSVPVVVRQQLSPIVAAPATNPVLYKWKDDQGHWNVSDQPPEGRPYETVTIDPDTNVLPSGVAPEQDQD